MPLIKSAIKKLRQDKRKTKRNAVYNRGFKETLKKALKSPGKKETQKAYSKIDKAAKKGLIHKKKAARLKSHAAKSLKKNRTK